MSSEFGRLLKKYRNDSSDPERGGKLTQERLAELLESRAGVPGYSGVRVSNWERGEEIIGQDKRELLVGLIRVFYVCGGIKTLAEANALLFAGDYRDLSLDETAQINKDWHKSREQEGQSVFRGDDGKEDKKKAVGLRGLATKINAVFRQFFRAQTTLPTTPVRLQMYAPACGDKGIDLGDQRLLVSTSFGAYFTGLLERGHNYIQLENQIECPTPKGQEQLSPLERIFWALHYPKGPRILIIAGEGGMGKSTLTAKIVRCLSEEQIIDMILGDSAKNQQVDIFTGKTNRLEPGLYSPMSCYERLCNQLGLPLARDEEDVKQILTRISDRLIGRRALIIVDNLETVEEKEELLYGLNRLVNKDIRVIVTTRQVSDFASLSSSVMTIHLKPIVEVANAQTFLHWHINHFAGEHPALQNTARDLDNAKRIQGLIGKTGGIPLLLQLVISDIARYSWNYLDQLPYIFGNELLNYLYQARWEELEKSGEQGILAQQILHWVATEQYRGRRVSFARLADWAQREGKSNLLTAVLQLLYERFLIVNQDPEQGNFVIFPSLTEFLRQV